MGDWVHVPVMLEEVMSHLLNDREGTYWDGTFGRGGHSMALLSQLMGLGKLVASDRDPLAQAAAEPLLENPQFSFEPCDFANMVAKIPYQLNGFLLDLGVSTPQLRDATRGFSFQEDGPLDMRMDPTQGMSAAELIDATSERELADIIYQYGEERLSRRIAKAIKENRPVTRTAQLADICRMAYPRRHHRIHPATRTFQALRIAVNRELDQLADVIPRAAAKLKPGGRGVIISFHSLEDRIVKRAYKALVAAGGFRLITKKPLIPSEEEAQRNPAARSAKMRVIEREES
ncbi:MAG: 16S rRNA (cytosine(1402)-N(4))-methyltransferase RsmH [Acidobacteria bacterium]|nr:16S rRNA (cytosine(1402)-N(4))-methyltransferase RsmH [Acidobacteriota bacterium]MCB9396565.1 16S rRNA (cytosine(1402)-N(4))-methyltransferase RsmH [Acidobacteriota bacterium]